MNEVVSSIALTVLPLKSLKTPLRNLASSQYCSSGWPTQIFQPSRSLTTEVDIRESCGQECFQGACRMMTQDNNCAHTHSKNHLWSLWDRAQQQLAGYSPRADSWACRVGHIDHSQMNGLSILWVGRSSAEKACQQKVPVLMKIICRLSMHAQKHHVLHQR